MFSGGAFVNTGFKPVLHERLRGSRLNGFFTLRGVHRPEGRY